MCTKVLDENFFACHHLLVLADERFPVLQNLLLLRVKDTQSVGVFACLLAQLVFDILYGGLVCDFDARR